MKDNKKILLIFEISDILNSTHDNDTIENILKSVEAKLNIPKEQIENPKQTVFNLKLKDEQPNNKGFTMDGKPINKENVENPAEQVKSNLLDDLMEVGGKLKQKKTSLKKKKPSKKQSKSKKTKRIQIKKRKQTKKKKLTKK